MSMNYVQAIPVAVLTPLGRLNTFSARTLENHILLQVASLIRCFVIDIGQLDEFDYSGLLGLVRCSNIVRQAQGELKIVYGNHMKAVDLLEMAQGQRVFKLHQTVDDALTRYAHQLGEQLLVDMLILELQSAQSEHLAPQMPLMLRQQPQEIGS